MPSECPYEQPIGGSAFLLYVVGKVPVIEMLLLATAVVAVLPQAALVFHYHVLTDQQLNEAIVITHSTPGPVQIMPSDGSPTILR